MLSIQVICLGRLKEKYYISACEEYIKRLTAFAKLQVVELPENAGAEEILKKIAAGALCIPLCIEGEMLSSEGLSDYISRAANRGVSRLAFVIGGSEGLPDAVKEHGDMKLSMSRMTFPHHFARVMLLEQIYRAFQIHMGGKYHK